MRRLILSTLAVMLLTAFGATAALANGGPHGNFQQTANGTNSEDGCAGCHRAHTGQTSRLLTTARGYDMCMICHGGSGATTNVLGGTITGSATALNGGMFGTAATSMHNVSTETVTAIPDSTKTMVRGLTCGSCHDPHGLKIGGVEQYRMLRGSSDGSWATLVTSNEGAAKNYTQTQWATNTSQFCTSCHDMPASINPNTHTVNTGVSGTVLPLQSGSMVCMTCHKPHGTSAAATGAASSNVTTDPNITTKSFLLRMDNRGVCQDCHKK